MNEQHSLERGGTVLATLIVGAALAAIALLVPARTGTATSAGPESAGGDWGLAASAGGDWGLVLAESFESGLTGWTVTDGDGLANGEYYWAATPITASQGMTSVWATGGGQDGGLLAPLSDLYPNNVSSMLVYGPVDLSAATAVSLTFDIWLETEAGADTLQVLASTDGAAFASAATYSGAAPGWQTAALGLNAYAGAPQFWLGFHFESDAATTARGVFLDNVFLREQPAGGALRLFAPVVISPPEPLPTWLQYVNAFRTEANLPPLAENADWSAGDVLHSRYMVKNDYVGHSEDPGNPWYTPEGLAAAQSGNVFVSSAIGTPDETSINFWLAAPFHAVAVVDPQLHTTGFGSYREAIGSWRMGATLDVGRGQGATPPEVTFPLPYPRDGGQIWVLQFNGFEFPDPLTSCPGYSIPIGPAILLQLGDGSVTPAVTDHTLSAGAVPLESCRFDETTYFNPNSSEQNIGRLVLGARDAVVIMPRDPLVAGQTYTASVTANGQTTTWTFTATAAPAGTDWPAGARVEMR